MINSSLDLPGISDHVSFYFIILKCLSQFLLLQLLAITIKLYSKISFGINIGLLTYRGITIIPSYRPALISKSCVIFPWQHLCNTKASSHLRNRCIHSNRTHKYTPMHLLTVKISNHLAMVEARDAKYLSCDQLHSLKKQKRQMLALKKCKLGRCVYFSRSTVCLSAKYQEDLKG